MSKIYFLKLLSFGLKRGWRALKHRRFRFRRTKIEKLVETFDHAPRIIAFGDSLVRGVGASSGRDWVSLLSEELGVPILNAGRNGDTTKTALQRLERDVLRHKPEIVIVLLGGNDALRGYREKKIMARLETIVTRIQAGGAKVVLVGIRGDILPRKYKADYEGLAWRTGALYVPNVLDGILGQQHLMADLIHPNDDGYILMAGRIAQVLTLALATQLAIS